jgi:VIT1/CCC1 family predicted Fe2+/Mn2+ transporter
MPMFIWPLLLLAAVTVPMGLTQAHRVKAQRTEAAVAERARQDAAAADAAAAENDRIAAIRATPLLLLGALALRAEQNVLGPARDLIRRLRHDHAEATRAKTEAATAETEALAAAPAWTRNTILRVAALVALGVLAAIVPIVFVLEFQSFKPTQGTELALLFAPLGIIVLGILGTLGAKAIGVHPTAEEWSLQRRFTVGLVVLVLLGYVLQTLLTFAPYRSSHEHDVKVANAQAQVDRDQALLAENQPVAPATLEAHEKKLETETAARTAAADGDRLYVGVAVMAELIALEGAWQAWFLLPGFLATRRRKLVEAAEKAAAEAEAEATDAYRGHARRVVADLYDLAQQHQVPNPGDAVSAALAEAQYVVRVRQTLDQVDDLDGLEALARGAPAPAPDPVREATDTAETPEHDERPVDEVVREDVTVDDLHEDELLPVEQLPSLDDLDDA